MLGLRQFLSQKEENNTTEGILLNNIGLVYSDLGDYSKALDFYQKALEIRIKILGMNHPLVADSYNNIGVVFFKLNDLAF